MKRTVKSFRISPWNEKNLKSFCKKNNMTATEVINSLLEIYIPKQESDIL